MTQRRIYQEEFPYFITFRTIEGYPLFNKTKYAMLLARVLFRSCAMKKYVLYAYCIMPDHVHLLVGHNPNQCSHRTLEKVRWELGVCPSQIHPQSTLSRVWINKRVQMNKTYNVSEFMQSIKGNFSRMVHQDHIWQRRFNTRIVNTDEYLATIIYYIKIIPLKIIYRKNFDKSRINILMGIKLKVFSRRFLACFIDS